jgi:RNA polymerase sigma factor (TIGR02999 family)
VNSNSADRQHQVSALAEGGHDVAQMVELYYQELKQIARKRRKLERNNTLNTTVLVHELYLQMTARDTLQFDRPIQFYAYAAQAMRHILIDRARAKSRLKAGGDQLQIGLDALSTADVPSVENRAIELDEVLKKLEKIDAKAAHVVELHFFAGQTFDQIAELLDTSRRTVFRDWEFARAYLLKHLK